MYINQAGSMLKTSIYLLIHVFIQDKYKKREKSLPSDTLTTEHDLILWVTHAIFVVKDRQQEAERHSCYLALLSISDTHNIISCTK